jgi:hypothetical protein
MLSQENVPQSPRQNVGKASSQRKGLLRLVGDKPVTSEHSQSRGWKSLELPVIYGNSGNPISFGLLPVDLQTSDIDQKSLELLTSDSRVSNAFEHFTTNLCLLKKHSSRLIQVDESTEDVLRPLKSICSIVIASIQDRGIIIQQKKPS